MNNHLEFIGLVTVCTVVLPVLVLLGYELWAMVIDRLMRFLRLHSALCEVLRRRMEKEDD